MYSQLDCPDHQRSFLRHTGGHFPHRRVLRRLWSLATAYYDCIHCTGLGCLVWLAWGGASREVSLQLRSIAKLEEADRR